MYAVRVSCTLVLNVEPARIVSQEMGENMSEEIKIDGIAIAPEVLSTIVSHAVEEVEGVASIGVKDLATNLVSMFSAKSSSPQLPPIEADVVDDKLHVTVRVAVFFGYPFKKLAEAIRQATVKVIDAQVGVSVAAVDVCIDGLVFPKE